ncbi:MAG: DPP IV N-terminal domain-containing protein [Bacteroidetes bacterium]|nr:DPP IV N-terminal domain-containing protein [Bacteroidota bacterium]MBS1628618.1 DPP IV N-terminal domain-containing protein [Bacteroidota bacterium]
MKRLLLSAFAASLFLSPVCAQHRQYTMAEATNGMATTLAPKSIKGQAWRPGTHELFFRNPAGTAEIFNADNKQHASVYGQAIYAQKGFQWLSQHSGYTLSGDTLKFFDGNLNATTAASNVQAVLQKGYANLEFAPGGQAYAFTLDNNLWFGRKGEAPHAITADKDINIISGQAVHRNEFGIEKGIFFSPKGRLLAYYRMDQTMVEDYPIIDWAPVPAKNTNIKYPFAGRTSHQVTLQVYDPASGTTTPIQTEGPKDQYLTCVTWSPDERYIYIAILNRDQNHLWLNQYDAQTGKKVKTLLQEQDDKYVEPQHPLAFLPGSNTKFIWWSQRDGYMHLWLCDMEHNQMRCLTPGPYVVNDLLGFHASRKEIIFTSAKESPLEKHGYAVNWENGKLRRLDSGPGTHNYLLSEDGAYAFDVFSSETLPRKAVIRATDGTSLELLADAPNPLADFERPRIIDTTLLAADGKTTLYGKLILPTHFDPNKKYPVIVYLYNGPHVQLIRNSFPASGNLWYEYLAQHGYVVWTMDGRGSSNRGLQFEQVIFRHLGTHEMDDQLRGVALLKSMPFVDSTRMGVHGWSFGGFMTTSLMLRHPGVFKVAVAGGPVMDWSMYEVMYGERYMDTPEQNPEGYKESALYDKVKNLKGKLLVIHGTQDATVVWQHSIRFVKACVDAGIQMDYFVYPGYEHNVRGKDRVHLMQKITNYFDQNL